MDAKARQKALDEISAEDLAKIKAHQASTQGSKPVDQEWLLLAEFAMAYGWQAYRDVRTDKIELDEMLTLIEASRKVKASDQYKNAHAVLIGAGSAQSKNPIQTFKNLTREIIKQMSVKK